MADEDVSRVLRETEGIIEPSILIREITFRPEDIPDVEVTVRILLDPTRTRDQYRFELSHYVHSPSQLGPYVPSGPFYGTEALAIDRGIRAITDWIATGKRDGHPPKPNWLKPASD